jgi:hypothetical protein
MKAATAAATRLDGVADDVRRVSRRLDEACDASARAEAQHSDRLALLDGAVGEELRPAIGALRTQLEATSKECRKAKHRGAEGAAALAAAVDELRAGADATGEAIRRIDDKLRRCVLDDMLDSERETILSIAAARAEPLRVSALLNASASEQHEHARGLERRLQASPVRQCTPHGVGSGACKPGLVPWQQRLGTDLQELTELQVRTSEAHAALAAKVQVAPKPSAFRRWDAGTGRKNGAFGFRRVCACISVCVR